MPDKSRVVVVETVRRAREKGVMKIVLSMRN